MAEFTDADVTRLAEMLEYLGVMLPGSVAPRLLEQGVTLPPPPPDPAVVVTKEIAARVWPDMGWGPVDLYPVHADLVAAVRDLFTPNALEAAAAKIALPDPRDELVAAALAWDKAFGDGWRGPEGGGTSGDDVLRRLAAAAAKVQEAET